MKTIFCLFALTLSLATLSGTARADDESFDTAAGWNSCEPQCTGVNRREGARHPWCASFTCGKSDSCFDSQDAAESRCDSASG